MATKKKLTTAGRIGKAVGDTLAHFEERILGWVLDQSNLTPLRVERWLVQHNFRRIVPGGNAANPRRVADYAGFARWMRNSLVALLIWTFLFELYTLVLGTFNEDHPRALGVCLMVGAAVFGTAWYVWLGYAVGRVSGAMAWLCALFTTAVAALAIGMPAYQYYHPQALPQILPLDVKTMLGWGIPRVWAVLGFLLNSLVVVPLLWMARLGPALISAAFTKLPQAVKKSITEFVQLIRHGDEQAVRNLHKRTEGQMGMLMLVWATLALLTISLQLSPTVWGLYGGMLIAIVSIVVLWIRKTNEFLGNFLTKALYGVATGGLIFVCFSFGFIMVALMLLSTWAISKVLCILLGVCVLFGVFSAVGVLFTSSTAAEQNELERGHPLIRGYHRNVTGFHEDGTPKFEVAPFKPRNISFAWLRSPIVLIGIAAVALYVWTQVMHNPNPFTELMSLSMKKIAIVMILVGAGIWFLDAITDNSGSEEPAKKKEAHHG